MKDSESGLNDYLNKPVDRRGFLEEVGKYSLYIGSGAYILGKPDLSEGTGHLSSTPRAEYARKIVFSWQEPPPYLEGDYVGSHIYRGGSHNGPWDQLTSEPFHDQYVHEAAGDGVWNYYRVVPMCNDNGEHECGLDYGCKNGEFRFKLMITPDGTIRGDWDRPEAPKGFKIAIKQ